MTTDWTTVGNYADAYDVLPYSGNLTLTFGLADAPEVFMADGPASFFPTRADVTVFNLSERTSRGDVQVFLSDGTVGRTFYSDRDLGALPKEWEPLATLVIDRLKEAMR